MVSAISPTKTFLYFGMLYKKRMPGTSENAFVGDLEDVSSLKEEGTHLIMATVSFARRKT